MAIQWAKPPTPARPRFLCPATYRADVMVSATRTFAALARTGRTLPMGHARALAAANAATFRATGIVLVEEMGAQDLLASGAGQGLVESQADFPSGDRIAGWLEGKQETSVREVIL